MPSTLMTQLLTRCFLLSFSVFLIGLFACDKDKTTVINGRVVDKITGAPLDEAFVEFWISHAENPAPNNYELRDLYTDANGEFTTHDNDPISVYWVLKVGYLPKGLGTPVVPIEQGKENDVTIEMIPKDGVLKLNLENNTGIHDTVYVGIYSALQDSELGLSFGFIVNHPFEVPNMTSRSIILNLASEETIDIYWGYFPWPSNSSIKLTPDHGSVYVNRSDTTSFNISF